MTKLQVLITGSTGFVGGHFVTKYLNLYDLKTVDLRTQSVENISLNNVQTVVHLAALVHQMNGAPAELYYAINTELTVNLAKKARAAGVSHFIFMSTTHVYGQYGNTLNLSKIMTEQDICRPFDPYGKSKLTAESQLLQMQSESFTVSIIRSPLVYGPGGKGNINSLNKLIHFSRILPFNYSENRRSLIYVENLIYFIHLIIQKKATGIFFPQDAEPISIKQLVQLIAAATNKSIILFRWPRLLFNILYRFRPNIIKRLYGSLAVDSTKSNEILGYKPLFTTAEAMRLTFQIMK